MSSNTIRTTASVIAAVAFAQSAIAHAQDGAVGRAQRSDADAAASSEEADGNVIIVNARRTEENLADVPVAVTAVKLTSAATATVPTEPVPVTPVRLTTTALAAGNPEKGISANELIPNMATPAF